MNKFKFYGLALAILIAVYFSIGIARSMSRASLEIDYQTAEAGHLEVAWFRTPDDPKPRRSGAPVFPDGLKVRIPVRSSPISEVWITLPEGAFQRFTLQRMTVRTGLGRTLWTANAKDVISTGEGSWKSDANGALTSHELKRGDRFKVENASFPWPQVWPQIVLEFVACLIGVLVVLFAAHRMIERSGILGALLPYLWSPHGPGDKFPVYPNSCDGLRSAKRWRWVTGGTVFAVGFMGLLPHLLWSWETGGIAWFFNSYDEGYYGWQSMREFAVNRGMSSGIMHTLLACCGGGTQLAMIAADFVLPAAVAAAALFFVRPLVKTYAGLVAASLLMLMASELLALRSSSVPHFGVLKFLRAHVVPLLGGPAGLLQIENQTSTFWLFRTPEPQTSWVAMFVVLGLGVRATLNLEVRSRRLCTAFLLGCTLLGFCYLFASLSVAGAFMMCGVLTWHQDRKTALLLGGGGMVTAVICLGISLMSASSSGGGALVFSSRAPVLVLSALSGLLGTTVTLVRSHWRDIRPPQWLAIALGLTPLVLANQQLLTGRMIYLMNFENFGLAQMAAASLLIAFSRNPSIWPGPSSEMPAALPVGGSLRQAFPILVPIVFTVGLFHTLIRSQLDSYAFYLNENRCNHSYAEALRHLQFPATGVICGDFYATDVLPVLLGYAPNFVIARSTIFSNPLNRLVHRNEFPLNGAPSREALFRYLAATGTTPESFGVRLAAVSNPALPNWQDRFLMGSFLFSQADCWGPLTHYRDSRFDWIVAQTPLLVASYREFLVSSKSLQPVLFLLSVKEKDPLPPPHQRLLPIGRSLGNASYPLKAFRLEPNTQP